MARILQKELVRRAQTATRESNTPDLAVQADQDSSRGYQALSRVALATLSQISDHVAAGSNRKYQRDFNQGAADRTTQDVTGAPTLSADSLAQQTDAYRRAYLRTDGAIKVREWQAETLKQVVQAEPGTDIEPILKEHLGSLMQAPEFQDPQVKAALAPVVQRAADNIRQSWQQSEIKEIFTRQQEGLTEIAAAGIKDGSLLTPAGVEKLYASLNTADFAYLNRSDVDDILATAAKRTLASGDVDPKPIMEFLSKKMPGSEVSLLNGKHGDEIAAAAAHGERLVAAKMDAARDQMLADSEFELQGLAKQGRLTNGVIDKRVEALGLTGKDALAFRRHWSSENQQALDKFEREAKERNKESENARLIASGDWFSVPDSELRKYAGKRWQAAQTQEEKAALIQQFARNGVEIPQVKAMMERANPSNPKLFEAATQLYENLKKVDPTYAASYLSEATAGMLETHHRNVAVLGMTPQESIASLQVDRADKRDAELQISGSWKESLKQLPDLPEGQVRDPVRLARIKVQAQRLMEATPQLNPTDAVLAADQMISTQYTTVAGRQVFNIGMPKGGEQSVEKLLESQQSRMEAAGLIEKGEKLSAAPNPHNPAQWVVTGPNGMPITDPDTGGPIGFDPRAIAALHHRWTIERANSLADKGAAVRSYSRDHGLRVMFKDAENFDQLKQLPKEIADLQKQLSKNPGDTTPWALQTKAQLSAKEKQWADFQPYTKGIQDVPDDFIQFIQGSK